MGKYDKLDDDDEFADKNVERFTYSINLDNLKSENVEEYIKKLTERFRRAKFKRDT